jgi:hypothetical protein
MRKALPFEGVLYGDAFHRNEFTYGVAFYQRGYFEQAAASFHLVLLRGAGRRPRQAHLK